MDYFKKTLTNLKKKTLNWVNPNQNPSDLDRYAFSLLNKAEVDFFIQFMDKNPVNPNVVDYNKSSLLMVAQGIPSYTNEHTKLLSEKELEIRAVKAVNYLIRRGADINFRNKNGITALLSACHWGYPIVVEALLRHGADPNFGSNVQGFCTNPLLSAEFKGHKEVVNLLILFGANPAVTEEINNHTTGFRLEAQSLSRLYSAYNIRQLIYRRHIERRKGLKTVLATCSEMTFNDFLLNA